MHAMLPLCTYTKNWTEQLFKSPKLLFLYQESIIVFQFFIINFNKTSNGKLLIFSSEVYMST